VPRRIIDGEKTWKSTKLGQVEPESYRAEYTWMFAVANDVATFECDPRTIWGTAYAINRPSITPEEVSKMLEEFERVKLLFRWKVGNKIWGYWTGTDKRGLLPKPSERYNKGPEPPAADLERFLSGDTADEPRQFRENSRQGLGLGLGLDEGQVEVEEQETDRTHDNSKNLVVQIEE